MEYFFNQHGVNICPLSGTFLNPGQAFRPAINVRHSTGRLAAGGGTVILVRRGIVHYPVPFAGLNHLEATAIQVMLAGKPLKIPAAYLSPSHPLVGKDLTAFFGGVLPALLAGDMKAKHVG